MKVVRENFMGHVIYPLLVATVLAFGTWTWSIAADITILKEKVRKQEAFEKRFVKFEEAIRDSAIVNAGLQVEVKNLLAQLDRVLDRLDRNPR